MKNRNILVLKKIIQYSKEIEDMIIKYDVDFDKYQNENMIKYAISMCILQIGELANKFTEEFKKTYDKMPWRNIIAVRNRAVHAYEYTDISVLWGIAVNRIPELKEYCEEILKEIT
jgi:uncharacterized protein with HEPN domain